MAFKIAVEFQRGVYLLVQRKKKNLNYLLNTDMYESGCVFFQLEFVSSYNVYVCQDSAGYDINDPSKFFFTVF